MKRVDGDVCCLALVISKHWRSIVDDDNLKVGRRVGGAGSASCRLPASLGYPASAIGFPIRCLSTVARSGGEDGMGVLARAAACSLRDKPH